jgi:UDP-glucose:(heptosyl)LPS alpha-1,3-glucosyltransferase
MVPEIRNIAVVVPKYGLVGGGEKFVFELTERIAANDHYKIHVFANKWKEQSDRVVFHKVPIITFPRFLTTISFAWFANRRIANMNFDLIHSHERIFRADIFTMHSVPHRFWVKEIRKKPMSLFDYGTLWVEEQLIKTGSCKKYLPVSSITKEKFLQEFPVDPGKIQIIYPGVEIDKFDKQDRVKCRQEIRPRFGLDEKDTVILFVGMNFELKGLDQLISSIAVVKPKHPSAKLRLLVVGKGNEKKYTRLARECGLAKDVIFTGIWKEDIEKVYLASDIFSMLSDFDTFGMTVLEAMSASLPVIISENVGAKDLVKDGINGCVVKNDDIGLISSKIEMMLNEQIRKTMAAEARREAAKHTWDSVAEKVMKIYGDLTGG